MCQCKCFKQAKQEYCNPGKHIDISTDFSCPMCMSPKNRFGMHGNDGDYHGITLECSECHSYIKYMESDYSTVKEEFYFDNLCAIIEDNKVIICQDGKDTITFPRFEFLDKDSFFNKIKTYLVFL